MLCRIFNQRALSILITLFIPLALGCGSKTVNLTTSPDHPANPGTEHGSALGHGNMPPEQTHEESGAHSNPEFSPGAVAALRAMLDAYFAIGDQLASDTTEGVNVKAQAMLEAFNTLEGAAPTDLWSAQKVHTTMIHDTLHRLGTLSDIKATRIGYGALSDSFRHFIAAAGVPATYEKPVYSYVCGMAPDVPEGGIWLQTGESARNPYFGSAMFRCHSTKMQISVSNAGMSDTEDLKPHKHSH